MKHFMFVSNFLPHVGGVEYYVHDLATTLNRCWNDEIHIVCFDKSNSFFEQKENYIVHRVKRILLIGGVFSVPEPISFLRCLLSLFRNNGRPEIVWTHTRFFISSLFGAILSWFLRIKLVHVEHGTTYVEHTNSVIRHCARIWDHVFGRLVLSLSNKLIVVSPRGLQFVRGLGGHNPQFIPAGIHVQDWQFLNDSVQGNKNEGERLLFVGRLLPGKGLEILLNAMASVIPEDIKLDVVGDGPQRRELEEKTKNLRISDRVQFHGLIPRSELRQWYSRATVFVNPSLSEGGPLTLLEALAMGIPVVTTPVGCAQEYLAASGGFGVVTKSFESEELGYCVVEALRRFGGGDRQRCATNVARTFSWDAKAVEIRNFILKS